MESTKLGRPVIVRFVPSSSMRASRLVRAVTSKDIGPTTSSILLKKSKTKPTIELREYKLQPAKVDEYLKQTAASADLRKSMLPLKLFTMPDTGGLLNCATHLYCYHDNTERDKKRKKCGQNEEWKEYLGNVRPFMEEQKSTLYFEADLCHDTTGESLMTSLAAHENDLKPGKDPIIEYRRYQLTLGYDAVPKFLEIYERGVRCKLENIHHSTELLSVIYSDVGKINEVIEIWRHGDGIGAMNESRIKARAAFDWTTAVTSLVPLATSFTNTIHKPTNFSPFQ